MSDLKLTRVDWYINGTADYVITKKGDDFFFSIDDLEEIPFEEIKQIVTLVEALK